MNRTQDRFLILAMTLEARWFGSCEVFQTTSARVTVNSILQLFLCFATTPFDAEANRVVIVAHRDVRVDSLSDEDLRAIFFGQRLYWQEGQLIVPIVLTSGPTHETFLATCLQETAPLFRTFWMHAIFTGQARAPKATSREEIALAFVAETPGAVGYVRAGNVSNRVKIISVNPVDE